MIISHQHRFVFMRTHKTASTSVEAFLGRIAGADAVVTPIRWPEVPGHTARNYKRLGNPLRSFLLHAKHRSFDDDRQPAYYNHMTAGAIRKRMGRRLWNSYFTFCFERNPWEKVVSSYFWQTANGSLDTDFRRFVLTDSLPSDFDRYSLDGRTVGVDFVGRYECLEDDLRRVLDRLGIADEISLTREKGNFRPRDATVETMFDDEMSARVEQLFGREIRTFGYSRPERFAAPPTAGSASGPS